jgi:hypothetical protein
MTSARVVALALVVAAGSAGAAHAQAPWPNSQPQPQAQSAWPSNAPQPQAQPQAGWPAANAPQAQPQQAPWPANAPQGPMAAPAGPQMGGGFGGPPSGVQQECMTQFTTLRSEVEKRGMAAKAGGEKQAPREEMCKLVTAYNAAEVKWVNFAVSNMSKCGIPKQIIDQLKTVHVKTAEGQKKLCAAGPAGGPSAAPTLSDALGTATLPTREPEKHKAGGTLDTLTGNALAR